MIQKCERDFNGLFQLKFLDEAGGVMDQKYIDWEITHLIINLLNKAINDKREWEKKKKKTR